jgi:hypothetical protein
MRMGSLFIKLMARRSSRANPFRSRYLKEAVKEAENRENQSVCCYLRAIFTNSSRCKGRSAARLPCSPVSDLKSSESSPVAPNSPTD